MHITFICSYAPRGISSSNRVNTCEKVRQSFAKGTYIASRVCQIAVMLSHYDCRMFRCSTIWDLMFTKQWSDLEMKNYIIFSRISNLFFAFFHPLTRRTSAHRRRRYEKSFHIAVRSQWFVRWWTAWRSEPLRASFGTLSYGKWSWLMEFWSCRQLLLLVWALSART